MGADGADLLALKLHSTTDAEVWADEFMRINGARLGEIDRYLMITWFANAIETGVSHESRRQEG